MPENASQLKQLRELLKQVKKQTKMFDIEITPAKPKPYFKNAPEIKPERTPVHVGSIRPMLIFKGSESTPKQYIGEEIMTVHGPSMPHKSIKKLWGSSTGLCTLQKTENIYPPAKDVLESILWWEKSAKKELNQKIYSETPIGKIELQQAKLQKERKMRFYMGETPITTAYYTMQNMKFGLQKLFYSIFK